MIQYALLDANVLPRPVPTGLCSMGLGVQGVIQRNKLTPRLLKVFTDTGIESIDAAVKVCATLLHIWPLDHAYAL